MGIGTIGRAGVFAATAVITACGGGGGGGSNTVALKSEADVTREIANVVSLYGESGGAGAAASRSVSGKAMARSAAMKARITKGMVAKAETVGCDSGAYTYDDFVNVSRSMELFAVAPNVDYSYTDYNNCRFDEPPYRFTQDGYEEYGHNGPYSTASAESPTYGYSVWGSGSSSLVYIAESAPGFEDVGKSTERARGRFESRDNGTTFETREIVDFTLAYRSAEFNEDITLGGGETGNPLVIASNYVAGNATIDGPFFYGTAGECSGGRLDYDTVEPMVFAEDGNGTYLSDGVLAISSGSVTVTLTFQADGDVSYELSSGEIGEITRAELAGMPACGVFI